MNRFFLLILIVLLSSTINAQDLIETDSIIENLGEIEIIAHRKLVKHSIGKIEYDVKGDNDACAMSVMDILKKVPMVIVDANDEISINGSKIIPIPIRTAITDTNLVVSVFSLTMDAT